MKISLGSTALAGALALVVGSGVATLAACGGDDEGSGGSGASTSQSGTGASSSQGGSGQGGSAQGGGAGQGGSGGSAAVSCSAPMVNSSCQPEGVVRVVVRLGAGMAETSGSVQLALAHEMLGQGSTGGVFHTSTSSPVVAVGPDTPTEIHFDFCQGGEMWSEDNCGFNLWAFVDVNGNTSLDPGEPAGRTFVDVSCMNGGPHCFELVLDCDAGNSCVGFTDPGGTCSCATPTCGSANKISTCI